MFFKASNKRFAAAAFFAALVPLVIAQNASAQSLKVDSPAPMKAGSNRAVIDSFGSEQFWTFTATGHFQLAFSRSGAQEGFNVAKAGVGAVFAPKTPGAKMTFVESQGGTVFTGDVTQPTRVIVMVEPAKSSLVRQTNDYTLEASGAVSYSSPGPGGTPSVAGTYDANLNNYGTAKFTPDGQIITTSGTNGTWKLFDADTRAYVIMLGSNRLDLTFEPGRGFVDHNGIITFTQRRSAN